MPDWGTVFLPTVPILELAVRGAVSFLALLLLLRVVGQREAGGLGVVDLLVVVLVAHAAGPGMTEGVETIADSFLLVLTILVLAVLVDALAYRFPVVARITKARPRLLVRDGTTNLPAMRREFMTREELLSQLRLHGIEDLDGVHRAYLEPGGMVSVIPGPDEPAVDPGPSRPPME